MAIPQQVDGKHTDNLTTITCNSLEEAKAIYQTAAERLLHVNEWKRLSGAQSAEFQLCNQEGHEKDGPLTEHDHIRIDVPGPGSATGEGYDWVKVIRTEELHREDLDELSVTVKPATNPRTPGDETAHFFDASATSTFVVRRQGLVLEAAVHGRNEKPNDDVHKTTDVIRNVAVAAGAMTGFSKLQWKHLTEGVLSEIQKA